MRRGDGEGAELAAGGVVKGFGEGFSLGGGEEREDGGLFFRLLAGVEEVVDDLEGEAEVFADVA